MSYDIRFGVKVAGTDEDIFAVIGEPERSSPTYNNRDIFVKSMGWDYHQGEWYKLTDVIPYIERGIHELQFNKKAYKDLEPDNGWGGIESSLEALQSIMKWITQDMEWSWNGDIPKDLIYMRW